VRSGTTIQDPDPTILARCTCLSLLVFQRVPRLPGAHTHNCGMEGSSEETGSHIRTRGSLKLLIGDRASIFTATIHSSVISYTNGTPPLGASPTKYLRRTGTSVLTMPVEGYPTPTTLTLAYIELTLLPSRGSLSPRAVQSWAPLLWAGQAILSVQDRRWHLSGRVLKVPWEPIRLKGSPTLSRLVLSYCKRT